MYAGLRFNLILPRSSTNVMSDAEGTSPLDLVTIGNRDRSNFCQFSVFGSKKTGILSRINDPSVFLGSRYAIYPNISLGEPTSPIGSFSKSLSRNSVISSDLLGSGAKCSQGSKITNLSSAPTIPCSCKTFRQTFVYIPA